MISKSKTANAKFPQSNTLLPAVSTFFQINVEPDEQKITEKLKIFVKISSIIFQKSKYFGNPPPPHPQREYIQLDYWILSANLTKGLHKETCVPNVKKIGRLLRPM